MERKGSGFGKIIGGYEFQVNYDESKRPSFRSDRYQFTVIMPNLNYVVLQGGTQEQLKYDISEQIKNMIRNDNKISTEKMSMALGVSVRTIKRRLKQMDEVHFIGNGSNGYWKIDEQDK